MIIEAPQWKPEKVVNLNQELMKLEGELDEKTAQETLAKFLMHNLGFTVDLLTGGDLVLYKYQEMILNGWFQRNYCMNVLCRGGAKSFTACAFLFLYPIFYPESKIVVASSNFRTSRRLLEQLEKFVNSKNAALLRQCFPNKLSRRADQWHWAINGGEIVALPLSEGTRGIRANVLVCDEFLLLPEEIVQKVLFPFLTASSDQNFKIKIRKAEERLIREGKLKEDDKMIFDSAQKMICLSSASYEFEYLFKLYKRWLKKIYNEVFEEELSEEEQKAMVEGATYFVCQMSYEALPTDLIDKNVIQEAKDGGASNAVFLREYCARFVDDSSGFFSAKKMLDCTLKTGELPHTELVGDKGAKYILSIDPNESASLHADHFSMGLTKIIDEKNRVGCLVHNFAEAAATMATRIKYLDYLLDNFNIVYIIIDNAGHDFLESCNNSTLFKNKNRNLSFFEADFDNEDYNLGLKTSKNSYNLNTGRICHKQVFSSPWLRKSNDELQRCFDNHKMLFASKATLNDEARDKIKSQLTKVSVCNGMDELLDLASWQDDWIDMTKKECALVEVKSTSMGHFSFDLPQHLRRSKNEQRARKDSYTTLLLGTWALKSYLDMESYKPEGGSTGFLPMMF